MKRIPHTRPFPHRPMDARALLASPACMLVLLLLGLWCSAAVAALPGPLVREAPIPVLDWQPRSDWLNVRDFGAKGDGKADDTASIQAALSQVDNGGVVYLPAGTYRISATLLLARDRRMEGVGFLGHGRDTRLVWPGPEGGAMFHPDSVSYGYFRGLIFDGRGIAAVGITNRNRFFETESNHRDLALLNFTNAGFLVHPDRRHAVAEPIFDNCYFANNKRGIVFTSFNDYNFVILNCEFRDNEVGILCRNGQFLLRNSHFANSREVDILANPHHASSVRRVTSKGSRAFLHFGAASAAFAIQDVHVANWTDPAGAVRLNGAPVQLFDSTFLGGPADSPAVNITGKGQRLIASNNATAPEQELYRPGEDTLLYEVPKSARKRSPVLNSADRRFLQSSVRIPRKVFDAQRDFGAEGDGRADDTAAIQATIDAARKHKRDAIAYLPRGNYRITDTLHITGKDYFIGGASSGFFTRLRWDGPEDGTMIAVHNPRNLELENLMVGHHNAGRMNNAIDILHTADGGKSSMVYDGVWTYGVYQREPERKGFLFRDLGPGDQVLLRHVQGNLRVTDCAGAVILGSVAHEGAMTVNGYRAPGDADGLLGIIVRLGTIVTHAVYVHDNASLIMSDCYNEQSAGMFHITGSPDLPPGRITWTGGRSHCRADGEPAMKIENYGGEIFIGGKDFSDYRWKAGLPPRTVSHAGDNPVAVHVFGNLMMGANLKVKKSDPLHVSLIGNQSYRHDLWEDRIPLDDQFSPADLESLGRAFDDLSLLGQWDIRLSSPEP